MAAPYAHTSATFVPGGFDDDYYMPPPAPELVAPEPQRYLYLALYCHGRIC